MNRLGTGYLQHPVFEQLELYSDFYDYLSFSIMGINPRATKFLVNIDTYINSSIKGTVESIRDILKTGRINDAYALLRKYFDVTTLNIYLDLYFDDNSSLENIMVKQIDDWINGIEKMPDYRIISNYIKKSATLQSITELLDKDDRYKKIRDRCNDNTHYNFFRNLLLNNNEIHNPNRIKYLNLFSSDIENLFIRHLSYLFYLNGYYMMSSDYMDALELGFKPEEDSQYWVAPYVQKIFDKVIKPSRMDLVEEIKWHTPMQLK